MYFIIYCYASRRTIKSPKSTPGNGDYKWARSLFPYNEAIIVDGRTYVPVYGLFEQVGFFVWTAETLPEFTYVSIIRNDIQALISVTRPSVAVINFSNYVHNYRPWVPG